MRLRTVCAVGGLSVAAALLLAACSSPRLTGDVVSRTIPLDAIATVEINGGRLTVRQGRPASLVIQADRAVMKYVVARQDGELLTLGVPDDADIRSYVYPPMPDGAPIEFVLTTDTLSRIDLGDGEVSLDGFKGDSLLLNANMGTASLRNIDVGDFRCEMVGGVATVTVSGVATTSSHTNSSGSHYDDSGLKLR